MKRQLLLFNLIKWGFLAALLMGSLGKIQAEGSKDFRDYPGVQMV